MVSNLSIARDVQKPQGYASDGTDAVGFVQFWGNSPALDLLGEDLDVHTLPFHQNPEKVEEAVDEPFNVLISGAGDLRHVLKTAAYHHRYAPERKLHIYLHDKQVEVIARHIILLHVVNDTEIPIRERVEIFMSLFGNTLIREKDEEYVDQVAGALVDFVAEAKGSKLADLISLAHLKYKDRDALQEVIHGWFKKVPFDVEALRDQRCRGYYRSRFDYRKNLMDGDYVNNIKPVASIIHWRSYKEFCHTGVAFETRLGTYNCSNRTLASYTEGSDPKRGHRIVVRGYWGDIINSPYYSFGVKTDSHDHARLFKICSEQHRHTSIDVTEFNLWTYLQELTFQRPFHLPPEAPEEHQFPYASPMDRIPDVIVEEEEEPALLKGFKAMTIYLLTGDLTETIKKSKYHKKFHRAIIGAMACMPLIGPDDETRAYLKEAMAPGACVTVETMKYQAHFDAKVKLAFRQKVAESAAHVDWALQGTKEKVIPKLESDMTEMRARDAEKYAPDFMHYITPA
eukprot:GEMP01022006.1.p1 GENE.GEMP01022006.1~~GEMP01022006.1.p1  ORF type:complete len:529 (-),score=76.52 GEMP01022006.1:974-2509(-)